MTKYKPSGSSTPENLLPIQFILDLYWESIDAMQVYVESPECAQVSHLVMNSPYGEAGAFMCKESLFIPTQKPYIEL